MTQDPEVLRERLAKARAAKVAKAAAATAEPADENPLADLIAGLQKFQGKRKASNADLLQLGELLDRLDPMEHPDLTENPAIEQFLEKIGAARARKDKRSLKPGEIRGDGNPNALTAQDVQWTLRDVNLLPDGSKELVTWTPSETIPIIYNGVMCQCIADVEMTTEKAFYDVYYEHRRLMREAEQRKAYMFGKTNVPPPSEGRDGTSAAATVRAFMGMGGEGGGGRILGGYPGDARFELRDVPGAQVEAGESPA